MPVLKNMVNDATDPENVPVGKITVNIGRYYRILLIKAILKVLLVIGLVVAYVIVVF